MRKTLSGERHDEAEVLGFPRRIWDVGHKMAQLAWGRSDSPSEVDQPVLEMPTHQQHDGCATLVLGWVLFPEQ